MLGLLIILAVLVVGAVGFWAIAGLFGDGIEAVLQRRALARRLANPTLNVTRIETWRK